MEREFVAGFNVKQLAGVAVGLRPPKLVTPRLLDPARLPIRHGGDRIGMSARARNRQNPCPPGRKTRPLGLKTRPLVVRQGQFRVRKSSRFRLLPDMF